MTAVQELAAGIAAALNTDAIAGGTDTPHVWSLETPYDHSAWLIGPDGARLSLRIETYGAKSGRLVISGMMPTEANYSAGDTHGVDYGEITVSSDRAPAAIAREIVRRCLPVYLPALDTVTGRIARRLAAADARETLATELAELMGGSARKFRDDWQANVSHAASFYGELTPHYDGTDVHVDLRSVPAELARKLATVVREYLSDEVAR